MAAVCSVTVLCHQHDQPLACAPASSSSLSCAFTMPKTIILLPVVFEYSRTHDMNRWQCMIPFWCGDLHTTSSHYGIFRA